MIDSEDAFAILVFLTGSPNRIAVLHAIATDGAVDRRDLVDDLGLSRVTVTRILDALESRRWITGEGTVYRTTSVGEVVLDECQSLLDTIESMERLSLVLPWLPADFDVDIRRLRNARVTLPTWSDSVAPVRRAAEVCRGLDDLRVCASGVAPDVIKGIRDAAVEDETDVEFVATTSALEVVRTDPTMRGWFADVIDADGRVYEHPGHQYLIGLCDRTAIIGMNDESGMPRGLVESTDETVYEWVHSTIDRCRAEAKPLAGHTFSERGRSAT
jgi:predicted transcriptional regulator